MAKKRRGAPAKPLKDRKSAHITVWMTKDLKALMVKAAQKAGDAPGVWLRKVGERAASYQVENGA